MNKKEVVKRFCFVLDKQVLKDNFLQVFKTIIKEEFTCNMNQFEIFEGDNSFFSIVDIDSKTDVITI
ncbi:hypothetical protein UMM65_17120 [Aureibaculum sp. 2210JD6-5]|uniref:hypothetical protein n=1 Tax=Aureibaculum sp. 2210JD6-5 TaxID=3103957 RepID=UPI002AACB88E|nr:hypothetical protein [Aureibaculum sp. 2210JD6-5]MDY7396970.1 hypothetical protein [Aureibaculum sp. 2210JD6-5]